MNRSSITIRTAQSADVGEIAAIYLASVRRAYKQIATEDYLDSLCLERCVEQWERNVADESISILLAIRNGSVQGLAATGASRDEDVDPKVTGEIQSIYVAPDAWRKGIGTKLCEAAIEKLTGEGFETITLWVLERNLRARVFYERAAFQLDGRKKVAARMNLVAVRYCAEYEIS